MKHVRVNGIHNVEGDVWDFYSLEEMNEHKTTCSNWVNCLKDAKRYLGEKWHSNEIRYLVNGVPVYKMYRIVGFEDNAAFADYYWILRPLGVTDDSRDRFELWNSHDFYKNIIFERKKKFSKKPNKKYNKKKKNE